MTVVKSHGSFNNGRRWVIPTVCPSIGIDGLALTEFKGLSDDASQIIWCRHDWLQDAIVTQAGSNFSYHAFSACCYEDWCHCLVMGGLMEVFEINCIVPYLVFCMGEKLFFTNFEFQYKNNVT